jgi:hypothetical protein
MRGMRKKCANNIFNLHNIELYMTSRIQKRTASDWGKNNGYHKILENSKHLIANRKGKGI